MSLSDFHNELMKLINKANEQYNLTDFSKDNNNISSQKKIALTTLLALIANDTTTIKLFNQEELDAYMQMIINNIFRPIKHVNPKVLFYDELPDLSDPQWSHIELVYLILERIIHCLPNASYFNYDFIHSLYPMMGSPDINERKEIIHVFKEFIFNHINLGEKINRDLSQFFLMHAETQEKPFEVWTSLQIFLVICKLTYDHNKYDNLIEQSVLPLIKDKFSFYFDYYLTDVLSFYADGSPTNAKKVIDQVMRFWPKTNIQKMSLYTKFLAKNLSKLSQNDLKSIIPSIFKLFAKECNSDSTELAESSLSVITNADIESIINDNSNEIHEIMIPSIMSAVTDHWWPGIRDKGAVSIASIINQKSMDYVKDIAINSVQSKKDDDQNSYDDWIKVMNSASANYDDINLYEEKCKLDKEFFNCSSIVNDEKVDNDESDDIIYENVYNYQKDNYYYGLTSCKYNDDDHSKDNNDIDKSYGMYTSISTNYDDYYRTNNFQDDDIWFYDNIDY